MRCWGFDGESSSTCVEALSSGKLESICGDNVSATDHLEFMSEPFTFDHHGSCSYFVMGERLTVKK